MGMKMSGTSLLLMCFAWSCNAILVTKDMGTPRVDIDLNEFKNIGKDLSSKLNLSNSSSPLPPILCIPGVGGSQLLASVNKTERDHWYCHKSDDWYMIWLALSELVPGPALECWSDNFKLRFNSSTQQFFNASGVDIMPNDFGSTLGFEYVDPSFESETIYFAAIVNALLPLGYTRGKNLLGAPYDWRLTPNYLPNYFNALQQMIENAYSVNKTKVAIVAHSMGNLFFMTFLQTVSQDWKDKYILTYIATSPPWVGAVNAIQSLTSGYDFSIPFLPPASAKIVQRTFGSTYFLMPFPKFYGTKVLITTPTKNYTAMDYQELLEDIGVEDMYQPYSASFNLPNVYTPPGVNTYCLYGYNVTTTIGEKYTTSDFTKPLIINGDGDGTVPVESLTFCNQWIGKTAYNVSVKGYKGQDHVGLLIYPPLIQDVLSAIFNMTIT